MTNLSMKSLLTATAILALLSSAGQALAVTLPARITAPIDNTNRTTLVDSRSPQADPSRDLGAVSPSMPLHGISLIFSRTPAQQTALTALIAAQQSPASPQYHQWLTPDQFAAQFGVADSDIAVTEAWLQQQGFTIDSVSRSRNGIFFSGTAAQVGSAFGAPLHHFSAPDGSTHFAPATNLTLPAALASSVLAVENLSSFRLKPRIKLASRQAIAQSAAQSAASTNPLFTSAQTGSHYLTPGDLAVMYDVKSVYSAGYTGVGQSIAVVGQSAVYLSDIAAFQAAAGVAAKTPINVLVPDSGVSTVSTGDETESDLDLEYTSTIAPGAQVYFVYTGDNSTLGVFQAIEYAVDEDIAPILSASYGACEVAIGASMINTLDAFLQQGTAQGQTILTSAGDTGSTDCYGSYVKGSASNYQLAVDYPASSPYVTAMGGTEIPVASSAASNPTYFTAASGTDVVTSLKSYVPEQVWNDDALEGNPSSGGGGTSSYEARPSWQAGTFGGVMLASGTYRLVPDISLVASNYSAPLLLCTSDSTAWNTAANGGTAPYQVASCNSGFRDASSQDLTAAGGTSFDSPIFAGLLALLSQARQTTGQGNINPILYSLASNASTYASAFHDIAVGGNQCLASATVCGTGSEITSYASSAGYDEASGLGSIDLFNLLSAWPTTASSSLLNTTTTVSPAAASINYGASDTVTITVAQYGGGTATTAAGTVSLVIDGAATTTLTLAGGSATYAYTPAQGGIHVILAKYSGDTTHAASSASGTLTVNTFTLSATNPTITSGSSGTSTLTLTPIGTFTGSVTLTIANYSSNLAYLCISGSSTMTIATAGVAATEALTLYTSAATCAANNLTAFTRPGAGKGAKLSVAHALHASAQPAPALPGNPNNSRKLPAAAAFACLLLTAGLRRRKLARAAMALGFVVMLSLSGLGLTGCSNGAAATPSTNNTAAGTYTIFLGAQDTLTGDAVASATVTVTVK